MRLREEEEEEEEEMERSFLGRESWDGGASRDLDLRGGASGNGDETGGKEEETWRRGRETSAISKLHKHHLFFSEFLRP